MKNIKTFEEFVNESKQTEAVNEDLGVLDGFNLAAGSLLFDLAIAGGILALGGIALGGKLLKDKVDDIIKDRRRVKGAKEALEFMTDNDTIKELQDIISEVADAEKLKNDKRAKSKKQEYADAYKEVVARRKAIGKKLAEEVKAAGLSREAVEYLGEQIPYIKASSYFRESVDEINESTNEFMEMKRDIFGKAKKQYLDGIKSRLEKAGFKVGKIKADYESFDDFSNDTIDCTYKGKTVKLTMSISGASLGVSNMNIDGYTTKIAVLAKKLDKLI